MADVPLMNNPMTTAGDIVTGGASGVPARLAMGAALQHLRVNAGATALEYADPPAGGGGSPVYDMDTYSAGNISIPVTTPAALTGPADLVVAAATGDLLEVGVSARTSDTDADSAALDFATIVSAAPVNYLSSGTGTPITTGVAGWYFGVSRAQAVCGSVHYIVQAGDISGGNVTLRPYGRASGAGKTLVADGTNAVFHYWVRNHGQ